MTAHPLKALATRFAFFTGKGGVGKTTLACATALSLAPVMDDQGADRVDGNGVQADLQVTRLAESTLTYEALAQAPTAAPASSRAAIVSRMTTRDGRDGISSLPRPHLSPLRPRRSSLTGRRSSSPGAISRGTKSHQGIWPKVTLLSYGKRGGLEQDTDPRAASGPG